MRMFEKKLKRVFAPKREELTGDWRIFCKDEGHNYYFSQSIIRMT
jgi:hypothetical protein